MVGTNLTGNGIIAAKCTGTEKYIANLIEKHLLDIDTSLKFSIGSEDGIILIDLIDVDFNHTHYLAMIVKDTLQDRKVLNRDIIFAFTERSSNIETLKSKIVRRIIQLDDSNIYSLRLIDDDTNTSVLVVESNVDSAALLKAHLKSKGYSVYLTYDGEKALELYKQVSPKIIITELLLPALDGYGLVEGIKKLPQSAQCKIIVLTEKRLEEDIKRSFELGVDDYMTKPYSLIELDSRMKRLIDKN